MIDYIKIYAEEEIKKWELANIGMSERYIEHIKNVVKDYEDNKISFEDALKSIKGNFC